MNYVNWLSGYTVADSFFLPPPDIELERVSYAEFREQMTAEVAAACEGALNAGAEAIVVKDAHGTGRNILPERLPESVILIRGWSGHPLSMIQELDDTFDASAAYAGITRSSSSVWPAEV